METTATPRPIKPAKRKDVCLACWSRVNWCESFDKFGHGQGDACVHTVEVAQTLREAGYLVETTEDALHNTVILNVGLQMSDGTVKTVFAPDVPVGNEIGYSDPREMLPAEIVKFLDDTFGKGEFFG
jgi:hypothetical protein